jgi:prolyl 4-hydroxylase
MDPFVARGNDGLAALRVGTAAPRPAASVAVDAGSGGDAAAAAVAGAVVVATAPAAPTRRQRADTRRMVERACAVLAGPDEAQWPAAVASLERGEAAGDPLAAYRLAWVALGNVLLPRDGRISERLLMAARQDHPPALRAAALHLGRKPNPVDQRLCVELLERAAMGGDMLSAVLLAERLQRGEGCTAQPRAAAAIRAQLRQHGIEPLPSIVAAPVAPPAHRGWVTHSTLAFEEALTPPPLTWLTERPRLARVDGVLGSDECRLLVASAMLAGVQDAPTATVRIAGAAEDFSLRLLQLRLARVARGELVQAEPVQVACRGLRSTGPSHCDHLSGRRLGQDRPMAGNRRRTVCVSLATAESGGGTAFPLVKRAVHLSPGSAMVFDNLRDDGSYDACSLHADIAIEQGEQWQATLWLREGRYRDA